MGCFSQVGDQALNIGRNAVLAAGFPESVPATTVDRQCGSSQQALHFAAQGIMAGAYEVAIAAGVESMSRLPIGASIGTGVGFPFGPSVSERYAPVGGLVSQGIAAEMVADKWHLSREALDEFAARSQQRAGAATTSGRFEREIVPLAVKDAHGHKTGEILRTDEGIRPDTTSETLAALRPAFKPDGKLTAGNSSQISDGASAILLMSEARAVRLGLRPHGRAWSSSPSSASILSPCSQGRSPPRPRCSGAPRMSLCDIDLVEINEAFASVVLAWVEEHHPDLDRVNVNGGAIALGHPVGASGAKLMATLLCELERSGGHYGLETMCEGGGLANATIIERLGLRPCRKSPRRLPGK